MKPRRSIFFIIGCARSGTHAMAKILDTCTNAQVFIEQPPKLCVEARDLMKGTLEEPPRVLQAAKGDPIRHVLDQGLIYGDKNPNYLPFIPILEDLWQPRYLFVTREGRDVVRSLMDWHELGRGNIYGMAEDEKGSTILTHEQDWWDYSRIRPNPGDELYDRWQTLNRFEKCSWYWAQFNNMALKAMEDLDPAHWLKADMSAATAGTIEEVFDFLQLEGYQADTVDGMLHRRINSAKDRYGSENLFPSQGEWGIELKTEFDRWAGATMERLGYCQKRPCP